MMYLNDWWREYILNWVAVLGGVAFVVPLLLPLIGFMRFGMNKHGDDE